MKSNSLPVKKAQNAKLVSNLKARMFRGFQQIKNVRTFNNQRFKYIKAPKWESGDPEPFEDTYNLFYRKLHPKLQSFDPTGTFHVENFQREPEGRQNQNNSVLFITDAQLKNKRKFSTTTRIAEEIFLNDKEKNLYSNVPFFYFERKRKKGYYYSENDNDIYNGLTDTQFLFRVSNRNPKGVSDANDLRKNPGIFKGFVSQKLKGYYTLVENFKINPEMEIGEEKMTTLPSQTTETNEFESKRLILHSPCKRPMSSYNQVVKKREDISLNSRTAKDSFPTSYWGPNTPNRNANFTNTINFNRTRDSTHSTISSATPRNRYVNMKNTFKDQTIRYKTNRDFIDFRQRNRDHFAYLKKEMFG